MSHHIFRFTTIIGLFMLLFCSTIAFSIEMVYGGRIGDLKDEQSGVVVLDAKFYFEEQHNIIYQVTKSVEHHYGVYQFSINLSFAEWHNIFRNFETPVTIEITDHNNNKTYPRQLFNIVPYALKTPVDDSSLTYNSAGKLVLKPTLTPTNGAFLRTDGSGNLSWDTPSGAGDMSKAENLSGLANTTTARSNLGLGNSATLNVGSEAGQVSAGNHSHSNATTLTAGFMSAADKTKLDGVNLNAIVDEDFTSAGLMKKTDAGTYTSVTDASSDWNAAYTATTAATDSNAVSTLVKRDGSGNFAAGAITATKIKATDNSGLKLYNDAGTAGIVVDDSGNVGINVTTPGAGTALNVEGQIKSGVASVTSSSIDFSQGNVVTTTFDCTSSISFVNLRNGGSYTLVVTGPGTAQCGFNTTTTGDDASEVTYRFNPANGARVANSHTVYSLMRVGTIVYIAWIGGF